MDLPATLMFNALQVSVIKYDCWIIDFRELQYA